MRNSLMIAGTIAYLFASILPVFAAKLPQDHTCKHRDGSEYACTAGVFARNEHIKACGAEWKVAKDKDQSVKEAGWPAFWSACSKRMKSAATSQ